MRPVIVSVSTKLLFSFLLCAVAGVAAAAQPSQAQISAIKQSCRSDYQSNCASVPTGGSAALQCLQQHQANLSPSCQTAVAAIGGSARPPAASQAMAPTGAPTAKSRRQQVGLMRNACGGDFRAYCRGVRPGGGRAISCLAANQARLSPSCQGALAQAHAGR